MNIVSRFVLAGALLLANTTAAFATAPKTAPINSNGAVRVGDLAPDFQLPILQGGQFALQDHVGKVPTLVVFWSYFCFPCQREIPALEEIQAELTTDALTVVGINLDGPEYDGKVLPFLAEHGITFPNVYDRLTEEFFEVAEKYGVVGTPTAFLLGPEGRIRFIHLGRLEPKLLRGLVKNARDQAYCAEITRPTTQPPKDGVRSP